MLEIMALAPLLVAACGGAAADPGAPGLAHVHQDTTLAPSPGSLIAGAGCDDLLARLQAELLGEIDVRAAEARRSVAETLGVSLGDAGVPPPRDYPSWPADPVRGALANGSPPAPADLAVTESDRLYFLHGLNLSGTLYVVTASPAEATEIVSTLPIEGTPAGLLVNEGVVTVFSRVYGPLPGYEPPLSYYYYYPTYTKITWVDTRGATPQVSRESYVEGDYVSAERDGHLVRGILRGDRKARIDSPNLTYGDIFGRPYAFAELERQIDDWASRAAAAIQGSGIRDYLITELDLVGGQLVEQPLDCGRYWLPQPGSTNPGYTRLFAVDMADITAPITHSTVMGYTQFSYANERSVLLAQHDYRYFTAGLASPQTNLHRFELDGMAIRYGASTALDGWIPNDTSLDEEAGIVRVLTFDEHLAPLPGDEAGGLYLEERSRVITLESRCASLVELGRTPDFSSRAESFPTRFVGNHAYVTTHAEAQALSVVELSDPAAPRVSGTLTFAPNADFVYPLWDGYLLALGQQSSASGPRPDSRWSLWLFDVRDPAAPRLVADHLLSGPSEYESRIDYTSLRFDPDQELIAFSRASSQAGTAAVLDVLRVSRDSGFAELASFAPQLPELTLVECLDFIGYPTEPEFVEAVQQDEAYEAELRAQCNAEAEPQLRRALFDDGRLDVITTRSVSAHPIDDLTGPPRGLVVLPRVF
jgi:beta propeller domain-containing protein